MKYAIASVKFDPGDCDGVATGVGSGPLPEDEWEMLVEAGVDSLPEELTSKCIQIEPAPDGFYRGEEDENRLLVVVGGQLADLKLFLLAHRELMVEFLEYDEHKSRHFFFFLDMEHADYEFLLGLSDQWLCDPLPKEIEDEILK